MFEPTQHLEYLGFILDSVLMRVTLTQAKIERIKAACSALLRKQKISIRRVAQVIGLITSSFPGVMYGPLNYRLLEKAKTEALKQCNGNYDCYMALSHLAKQELQWWIESLPTAHNEINHGFPDIVINSDASMLGWGGVLNGVACGGHWTPEESHHHINYLELLAAFYALKSFKGELSNKHVRLMIDNTTVVSCVAHMGTSHSVLCNRITKTIWEWCIMHNIWLSAAHVPGKQNVLADKESRTLRYDNEWMLERSVYNRIMVALHTTPAIDLFASRLNSQLQNYVSYQPDPGAIAIDAFTLNWSDNIFYAFPPFSLITRVLKQIQDQCATGVLIVPDWPTQVWYPKLMRMLINYPISISHQPHSC